MQHPLLALADAEVRTAARACLRVYPAEQVAAEIGVTVDELWRALGRRRYHARGGRR